MDVYEIALIYADSQHQGDRRKKSQQCYLVPRNWISFILQWNREILMTNKKTLIIMTQRLEALPVCWVELRTPFGAEVVR